MFSSKFINFLDISFRYIFDVKVRYCPLSQYLFSRTSNPQVLPRLEPLNSFPSPLPRYDFLHFRSFSALPTQSPIYSDEFEPVTHHFGQNYHQPFEPSKDDEDSGKISVRAFFLYTRVGELSSETSLVSEVYSMPSAVTPQWQEKASGFFSSSGVKLQEAGQTAGTFVGEVAKYAKGNVADVAERVGSMVKSRWSFLQQPSTRHAIEERLITAAVTTGMLLGGACQRQKKRS